MNEQVERIYRSRKSRRTHPCGQFDGAGRWYPNGGEEQECCSDIRRPTRAWPYSLMLHCRTRRHIAKLISLRKDKTS